MIRAAFTKKLRTLAILTALVGAAAMSAGCMIEVDENGAPIGSHLADLEVRWSINGADRAALCSMYGINEWLVELRGPETRDVVLDCRDNYWTTENDLLLLREGFYDVRVVALDSGGFELARRQTTVDLFDRGYVDVLRLDFRSSQF